MSSKFSQSNSKSNPTENHFNREKVDFNIKTSNHQFMTLELPKRFVLIFEKIVEEAKAYKAYEEKNPNDTFTIAESAFCNAVNNKNAYYYLDVVNEIYSNVLDDEHRQLFCEEIKQKGDMLETVSDILGAILKYVAVFYIEGITNLTQLGWVLINILNCVGKDIPVNEQECYKRGLGYISMNRVILHEGKYYYILSAQKK